MQLNDLLQRIRLGEDSTLALKQVAVSAGGKVTAPHADGLSDELAALGNAAGGLVVLGVDDKTRAVTGIPQASLDQVEAWVTAICTDRIQLSIESMTRLSAPRNEVLASLFGRYYPVGDPDLGRSFLMDRRGFGVETILRESERLSGVRPVYEQIGDLELCLTIFAAVPPPPEAAADAAVG